MRSVFWLTTVAGAGLIWLAKSETAPRRERDRVARRKKLDCLMFKVSPVDGGAPIFWWPDEDDIAFWRRYGWHLLVTESEIRFADLGDVREDDERGRR